MHLSPAQRRRFQLLAVMPVVALGLPAWAAARPIDLPPTPLARAARTSVLPAPDASACGATLVIEEGGSSRR
jgi:hypothetical protein